MYKCLLCRKEFTGRKRRNGTVKYCFRPCIRTAYNRLHGITKTSFRRNDKEFWNTPSGFGFSWEKWVAILLKAEHIPFNLEDVDVIWQGKNVDVKAATLYRNWWSFHRGKEKPIDFFACVCVKDNKPIKVLLIPNEDFPRTGLTVGQVSRWDKYMVTF